MSATDVLCFVLIPKSHLLVWTRNLPCASLLCVSIFLFTLALMCYCVSYATFNTIFLTAQEPQLPNAAAWDGRPISIAVCLLNVKIIPTLLSQHGMLITCQSFCVL